MIIIGDITDLNQANATIDSFKIKEKITVTTGENGTKNVETMIPLTYLSSLWRTPDVATNVAAQTTTFSITDTKLCFPLVTLSTWANAKLLEQLKSSFKITII